MKKPGHGLLAILGGPVAPEGDDEEHMTDGEKYASDALDAIKRRSAVDLYAAVKDMVRQCQEDEEIPEGDPEDAYGDKD